MSVYEREFHATIARKNKKKGVTGSRGIEEKVP